MPRAALPLAFVLLALLATLLAGGAFGFAALLTVLVELPIVAAWLAAGWGVGRGVLWPLKLPASALREVTAAGVGLEAVGLLVLLLGLAGLMHEATAWLVVLGGVVAAGLRASRERPTMQAASAWSWALLPLAAVLGVGFVAASVYPGILWGDEPAGYDVAAYHLQLPREWFEAGRITATPHNVFGQFPLLVELHYLLAMHLRGGPWAGMYLAKLTHLAHVALAVAAVWAALRDARGPGHAAAGALLAGAVPWAVLLGGVAYNEGGLMLYAALGAAWAVRAEGWRQWAVCGLAIGLACGVKYTAVPMLLIALPVAAAVGRRQLVGPAVALGVGLLVFSPWLVRNALWTGNPVFPQMTGTLGAWQWEPVQVERWATAHSAKPGQAGPRELWSQVLANWRYGFALFPLALAGLILVPLSRLKPGGPRRGFPVVKTNDSSGATASPAGEAVAPGGDSTHAASLGGAAVVLALLLVLWLIFWLLFTHLQSRFFAAAVPVLALAACLPAWRAWPGVVAAGGVVLTAVTLVAVPAKFTPTPGVDLRGFAGVTDPMNVLEVVRGGQVATAARLAEQTRRPLVLVGDAEAWFYPTDVRYRSIFDVAGDDALAAWGARRGDTVVVYAGYLRGPGANYVGVPAVPEAWPPLFVTRVE